MYNETNVVISEMSIITATTLAGVIDKEIFEKLACAFLRGRFPGRSQPSLPRFFPIAP